MRLPVLDESIRFSCGSCTACCDQPWRTLIEPDKARALDAHDFGAYPQLRDQTFYDASRVDAGGLYELAKGEGTRCLFLDTDGLCIIHKELGPKAKPNMCRQFPFLPARTAREDRISANFGCPSVQTGFGKPLNGQRGEILEVVGVSSLPVDPEATVSLDALHQLTQSEADAVFERIFGIFAADRTTDLWTRFAEVLTLLVAVGRFQEAAVAADERSDDTLLRRLRSGEPLPDTPAVPEVTAFDRPALAPMPVRFLFAATMYPDVVSEDSIKSAGWFRRLTLVPKLMALTRFSGAYSSRLMRRNIPVSRVFEQGSVDPLPQAAESLLLRYFQSRFWQRFLAGTRLSILAGVHQHIQDLNAILFLARDEAIVQGNDSIHEDAVRKALTQVEFHLANQTRLHEHTLTGWILGQLNDPNVALASLRLMAPTRRKPRQQSATMSG